VNPNNNPLADLPQHAHIAPTYTTDSISDAEGLKRAYATDSGLYSFNDRLYVAGTKSARDVADDITKIPAWGDSRSIQRYQDAAEYLKQHPNITEVSGHSLGGSVALQLQKDNEQIQHTRTYGAPALDFGSMLEKLTGRDVHGNKVEAPDRYANYGDPIALFDGRAQRSWNLENLLNPHSHSNISSKFKNSVVVDRHGNMIREDRIKNWEGAINDAPGESYEEDTIANKTGDLIND
jgi:hypothetical protein